ncbi:hypothetical protein CHRYSEOSP005_04830 [Chryseobacterium sp. Alg-005]|uniref:MmpS family transport accessory protein n=1 Tax=Chryseobacterium sp. Alg-005 TaxID=3159516 RepID=UPI003555B729
MKSNYLRKIFSIFTLLGLISLFTISCGGDDDDNPATPSVSRDFKYEVTGNYSGKLNISYIGASGSAHVVDINQLPWSKEFKLEAGVPNAVGFQVGNPGPPSGASGQTMTLKLYKEEKL